MKCFTPLPHHPFTAPLFITECATPPTSPLSQLYIDSQLLRRLHYGLHLCLCLGNECVGSICRQVRAWAGHPLSYMALAKWTINILGLWGGVLRADCFGRGECEKPCRERQAAFRVRNFFVFCFLSLRPIKLLFYAKYKNMTKQVI